MSGSVGRLLLIAAIAGEAMIGASSARAQDAPAPASDSIWQQQMLTGDWGGERTALHNKGIDFTLSSIDEIFGVLSGGVRQQPSYEGRTEFTVDADLAKLLGWNGASAHITVFQIRDSGYNVGQNVGAIADPSSIDALPTTRLSTLWFQHNTPNNLVSLRIGQLAADTEFMISPTAANLINSTFGWPDIFASDMISGGPAYPLSAPGVRLAIQPTGQVTLRTAVFSGNPAGADCTSSPQACDRYGTRFSFSGGALGMGELNYAVNQGKDDKGLPATYAIGVWDETADFADEHFGLDAAGGIVSLADTSAVASLEHRGNWGVYALADQTVWRVDKRSISLFARASYSPPDRNLISYYFDAGAGFKGFVPGRDDDMLTFGFAYAKISPDLAGLDVDLAAISGPPCPVQNAEAVFELTYQAQVAPWWTLQPDLQYIVHPGGSVSDPDDSKITIGNAFVAGVRSTITF